MSAVATRAETQVGRRLAGNQVFEVTRAREKQLSRLLILYITTGLAFMLLPGTFLGVWNLLTISTHRASNSVSAGWVQAHGHAQIFGWIGTFILGIGFYSIQGVRFMRCNNAAKRGSECRLSNSGSNLSPGMPEARSSTAFSSQKNASSLFPNWALIFAIVAGDT